MTADLVIVQNTNVNVPANLKGKISDAPAGTCPGVEFKLTGWTVAVSASTAYSKGKSCTDLAVGVGVHVKGTVDAATGKVQAKSVQFDK